MDINQIAENFNDTFRTLRDEDKELRRKISTQLTKRIEIIWPIVKVLKSNNVYFTHPDIDSKTIHGIIVGKDYKNYSTIYICKEIGYVHKVTTHSDEIDGSSLFLQEFLEVANIEFAIKGIEAVSNRPTEIIEEFQRKIEKEKLIFHKFS